jgi:hypothetical protein
MLPQSPAINDFHIQDVFTRRLREKQAGVFSPARRNKLSCPPAPG